MKKGFLNGKLKAILMAAGFGLLNFIGLSETTYLYNFNDETIGACDGTATDSGSSSTPNNATMSNYTNATWDYLGGYNCLGLTLGTTVNMDAKMTTASAVSWGSKFVLEARIWKGTEETPGQIDLIKTADGTTLKWYIDSDGKMHLELNDGNSHTANVVSTNSVISADIWTTVCAMVDLTQETYRMAVKFYVNPATTVGNVCSSSYAYASEENASYPASNAFDGNYNYLWASLLNTNMSGNLYIAQDFGANNDKHVRQLTIRQAVGSYNYTLPSFKVQRSANGSDWTDVTTISTPTDNGIYTYPISSSGAAQYWRLLANAQNTSNYWKMYEIEMEETSLAVLSETYTYSSGITLPATNVIDMFQRIVPENEDPFTLKCGYIKITSNPSTTYTTVYTSTETNYVKEGSSSAVIVNPLELIRRVTNPASDFTGGVPKENVTIAYDNHPTTPSVFHGIFELNFQLDTASFDGTVTVDIYIQKPEESTFKKIGQVTTTEPVGEDPWDVQYYWDSRTAAYDWTSSDAQAYRTDGLVKFKFQVR
ncbi:MAG: hypothetical protein A2020_11105 [Lentisphaerae bacterium GWF2_45_14]|nr:MAG: hypothetical protein A2020_11105 [Lentisphaerae bacterium GWF2_45_14]